jgi:hypothetical protein
LHGIVRDHETLTRYRVPDKQGLKGMTGTVRNLLIVICFSMLSGCAGSSSTPWTDMKHLYDNEVAPTQSRVARLEAEVAENEREIADLKAKVRELRTGRAEEEDTSVMPSDAPMPSSGKRLLKSEMLERDRSLNRTYGTERLDAIAEPATDPAGVITDNSSDEAYYYNPDANGMGSELYAIHLASYSTLESAAAGWRVLSAKYPDLLLSLTPWTATVLKADSGETFHRLLAGPLTSKDKAAEACADLEAAGAYCKAIPFEGDPLTVE